MYFHSGIFFKELLRLLCVFWVQIDTDDFRVISLKFVDDFFQGSTSSTSNIKEVSFQHCHVVHHLNVCDYGKESTDKEIINEDRYLF